MRPVFTLHFCTAPTKTGSLSPIRRVVNDERDRPRLPHSRTAWRWYPLPSKRSAYLSKGHARSNHLEDTPDYRSRFGVFNVARPVFVERISVKWYASQQRLAMLDTPAYARLCSFLDTLVFLLRHVRDNLTKQASLKRVVQVLPH